MEQLDTFLDTVKEQIVDPIITLLALAAFALFTWGVVLFIKNAEDEEKRETGKRHMVWGIVGLAVIFGARAIIAFVGSLFGLTLPD